MRHMRWGVLLLLACASWICIARPGATQSVGNGGVSQTLAIYDMIDLQAFRICLQENSLYLQQQLLLGQQITGMTFQRFATTGNGQRAYLSSATLEPPGVNSSPVARLNMIYVYTALTPLPALPPDRLKTYLNGVSPIYGTAIISSPLLLDYLLQILAAPPAEIGYFLSTKVLTHVHTTMTNGPGVGGLRLVADFTYGGPGTAPVTVNVQSDCVNGPGGMACGPWIVTVN